MPNAQNYKVGDTVYINWKSAISSGHDLKDVPAKVLGYSLDEKSGMRFSLEYFDEESNRIVTNIFHSDWVSKEPKQKIEQKSNNQIMKTQEQIDQEIKELENKIEFLKKEKESQSFEAGDWFFTKLEAHDKSYVFGKLYEIVKINELEHDSSIFVVRFNEHGANGNFDSKYARKATESEIEAHLIKLAEESGLKVGGKVPNRSFSVEKFKLCSGHSSRSSDCYKNQYNLKYHLNICFDSDTCCVPFEYIAYQQSKLQPKIIINNYDAEFCAGYVKFGCAKFDNSIFQKAKEFIDHTRGLSLSSNSNRTVSNIKIGEGIFTPTDIDNIVKRLKP